jgi:DNA-binding NtrC family response regulator
LPPLRHRKAEIPVLVDYFVAECAARFVAAKPMISPELKNRFLDHSWPGNLEEMETVVKTLVVLGNEQVAQAAMEASSKRLQDKNTAANQVSLKAASRAAVLEAERELILDAMARTQNRRRAAEQLQISYKALLYKLRQIGWESPAIAMEEE